MPLIRRNWGYTAAGTFQYVKRATESNATTTNSRGSQVWDLVFPLLPTDPCSIVDSLDMEMRKNDDLTGLVPLAQQELWHVLTPRSINRAHSGQGLAGPWNDSSIKCEAQSQH